MSSDSQLVRRPLRVAMVHYRDAADAGGSLRVGETIANHLDPKRVTAEMVFAYGKAGSVARRAGVPCHFIGASGPKDFPAWVRARGLFKRMRPDLVHFLDGVVWLRTALLGTSYKTAVHLHARYQKVGQGGKPNDPPVRATPLLHVYLKSTDAQICINNGARESLLNLGWISHEQSYVVYNSIDLSRFSGKQDQTAARAQLSLPPDPLLLGMVCRLVWDKGCGDLLSIIERLPPRWQGVICGDGPLRQELESECKRRHIEDRIHFLGLRDDVAPVYASLDAYAFLSRHEAFGLVLAEAMASGVPVFGIEGDGGYNEPEYPLLTAETASLVPFVSARTYKEATPQPVLDQIALRVSNYGTHPDLYQPMIDRARMWVSELFAAPLQADLMAAVYENICEIGDMSPQKLGDWYQSKRTASGLELASFETSKREGVRA